MARNIQVKKGTLFIAPLGARNKEEPLFEEIISLHPGNDYSSVLYLAPNNSVLAEAKSRFFSFPGKGHNKPAYIPFQSFTIKQLASNLYDYHGANRTISDRLKTLIICDILKDKNIGYATLLADLLKKITHYIRDKDINLLKEETGKLIFEEKAAERAVRALEILEAYQAELRERNLIDTEGMLRNSIDLIKINLAQYNGLRTTDYGFTLVIDGFFDPTPLELEIMTALIDTAGKVCALVEEHSGIYKYFRANKLGLREKKLKRTPLREKTGYFKYPSIEDEVEGIAKNVKKLILEGLSPWDVTVSFPAFAKYLPMLRRTLKKYGIPFSIGEYNLSSSRPFAALEDMISCVEEDYPRNNFLSFLTSPCFPGIPEIVKERAVSYSYTAGIVKGKDSWLSLKDILLNSPKGELTEDARKAICEFQDGLEAIMDILEGIKKNKDLLPFIDAVESALESFGFFDSPGLCGPDEQGRRLSDIISGQIAELRDFAGQRKSGEHGFQRPAFYLRYMLKDLKGSDENRDGVRIMPFELAAGIKTKALFFGGVIEGDLPSMPDIDPILPERVKKELGLPYLDHYLDRQKRYFTRLLNAPLIDTFFSCPSADGDKVFLPSPFLDWEKSISPADLKIYSEQEVLIREGAIKHTVSKAGIFDGKKISHGKKAPGMLRQRIKAMSKGFINVTDIDYYRRCPLRFYVERVLCLEIITPPKFEVEARLWGNLAHRIMEHLFKNGDIDLDKLDEKVFQGLEKSLKQFPIENFWAEVAKEIFQRLLPLLKKQENDIRIQGYRPFKTETKLTAEINGLKLKGKVDRVDRGIQSTDKDAHGTVNLIDYKTGNIDSKSLQLPLYAAIWRKNFSEAVKGLGYYSLKDGRINWYPGKITMGEFVGNALQHAEDLVMNMKSGMFPPEPYKAAECRYCYHSPLCNSSNLN